MDQSAMVEAVRAALSLHPRQSGGGYPPEVKAVAVRHARTLRAAGLPWAEVGAGLPMSSTALQSWMREEDERRSSAERACPFPLEPRRVEVLTPEVVGPSSAVSPGGPRAAVLVSPRGYRVEGLAVSDVLDLLRMLG